jgi:hypothetical protein
MKRLIPFLILAAFFFGISGGGVGRSHVSLKICAYPQSYPQFSLYLPCDDVSNHWDVADQPLSPPGIIVYAPKPSRNDVLSWKCPGQTSPKHYALQGLGCGGLPS